MSINQFKKIVKLILTGLLLVILIVGLMTYLKYIRPTDYEMYHISGTLEPSTAFESRDEINGHVPGMVLISENEFLKLYMNASTTEVAIYHKSSGYITYSNPQMRSDDPKANAKNIELLGSQITIEYYNKERLKKEMNNYSDAIVDDQFSIESIKDGVRITYNMGDLEKGVESMPRFLSPERLQEKLLDQLDEKSAKTVQKYYVESAKEPGYLEMRDQVGDAKIVLTKMLKAFEEAGYTEEDLVYDNGLVNYVSDIEKIHFAIPIEYKLQGDRLLATINTEIIESNGPGSIATLQFMNYFGAGGTEDSGYLFVPSGSGALIEFNNNKLNQDYYYERVYGFDPVTANMYATQNVLPIRMPVYGIKKNDQAIMARITKGDAIAAIKADISGRINSYNYVSPVFTLRDYEQLSMFGTTGINADLPLLEKRSYSGDLTIEYHFLSGEMADYSGMAKTYQNALVDEGVLSIMNQQPLPFYLDLIGAIQKKSFVMGIPYYSTFVMTQPDEAEAIVKAFSDRGVKNIQLRYQGWFNGGFYHDVARDIDYIGQIGGKNKLLELDAFMTDLQGQLFLDAAFAEVSSLSDHYSEIFESSRYIAGVNVFKAPYHPSMMRMYTFYEDDFMRIVSPAKLSSHVQGFKKDYNKLNINQLALRDLGDVLASDKKTQAPVDREWAKDITVGLLDSLSKDITSLLIEGGNAYSWANATDIVDVPMSANRYYLIDRDVPFMQMVLHGYVRYGSQTLNLADVSDERLLTLKMIETGTAPRFALTHESTSEFVKTPLQAYYSTQYEVWLEKGVTLYSEISGALDQIQGSTIIKHSILDKDVFKVEYSNGINIYVNYSINDVVIDGTHIPAYGYVIEGGGMSE